MLSSILFSLLQLLASVAAQSGVSSSTSSIGYGPFGNASMTPNGNACGECNIFYFPNLRVWNESNPDGTHDNYTVATAYVAIDEATNATSTVSISPANTTVPCNGNSLCVLFESDSPPVKTYTFSAGPSGINITQVVTSPTALIYWGAYSLQGGYPTTDSAGSTFCNSTTIDNSFTIVPFIPVTTYPFSDIPAPYTGVVPVPSLSFEDLPFPTAEARNFLAQFSNQNAFSYCTPLRYYGSPAYASPVMQLTTTSFIRQAALSTTAYTTTSLAASTAVRPTPVPVTSTSASVSISLTTQPSSLQSTSSHASVPPPVISSSILVSSVSVAILTPSSYPTTAIAPTPVDVTSTAGAVPGGMPSEFDGTTTDATTIGATAVIQTVVSGIAISGTTVGGLVGGGTVIGTTVVFQTPVGGTSTGKTTAGALASETTGVTITSGLTGPISSGVNGGPSPSGTTGGPGSSTTVVSFQGGSISVESIHRTLLIAVCGMVAILLL